MSGRPKAVMSWSSGKDSAWALHLAQADGALEVVGLLTTVTEDHGRVAMHSTREAILDLQAERIGLPLTKVALPSPCPNEEYERRMGAAMAALGEQGVTRVIFGDLFLEDIRAYREAQLARAGMEGVFPIWRRDTAALAREMVEGGLRGHVVCVDPKQLDPSFAGRTFGPEFLADLPAGVDPCGENGEFHTAVTDGPMFRVPIAARPGEVVTRDGFVFADLVPE